MKTTTMLAALLALGLGPVLAADKAPDPPAPPPPPQTPPETPPPPAEPPVPPEWKNRGARKQGQKLAAQLGVTEQAVFDLRAKGLGWGEVRHALAIAQKSGQPLSEVLKLKDSGMGWGQIAQHYGFKLGEVGRAEEKDKDGDEKRDAVAEPSGDKKESGRAGEKGGEGRSKLGRGRPTPMGGGPKR